MKKHSAAVLTATILTAALTAPAMAVEAPAIRVSNNKGNTLESGECNGLIIGPNLTVFTGTADAAQCAVNNWINSPGHFETMIDPRCDCIGVGVTQYDGITYCYMFVGIPNSVNFYG